MEKRMKLIAIALGIISLIAAIIAFSYISRYNSLTRDYQQLKKEKQILLQENEALANKAAKAEEEAGNLRQAQEILKKESERLAAQRVELQDKYSALQKERDKLLEKLQQSLTTASASLPPEPATTAAPAPVADEYWAGLLREKGELELQLLSLKDALKNNLIKVDEISKEKSSLDMEIQKLTKEKADIQRQLEYNGKLLDSISLQLVREKEDKRKIQKHASSLKEENSALRSRLNDMMGSSVSLEKKLKETEDKRAQLYERLNQMDQLLQDKLSEVLETKQDLGELKKGLSPSSKTAVELAPIIVPGTSPASGGVNEAFPGRVVSVNEEKGFVIFDKGENQGIRHEQTLGVYQDSEQIAILEVIQVRPDVSAADIKKKTARIKVGDVVR
jgi:predicted nuclease with TOPRIM domain